MRSGKAVSSHSGKSGGLLRPIARKRNLISLRSAAFFTIFVCIWSTPTNFTAI